MKDIIYNEELISNIYIALIICLILILTNLIYRIYKEYKLYKVSGFYHTGGMSFCDVLFSNKKTEQYNVFSALEKVCRNGHLLCNLELHDRNNEEEQIEIVMIDKYGISIFITEDKSGTISGNENDFYWKVKKGLITRKTYNRAREARRKVELLKDMLKIKDSSIINCYVVFNNATKYNGVKIKSRNIRLVKSFYMKGVIAYEINNARRVLSDSEVKAYTIMLEKYTKISKLKIADHIDNILINDDEKFNFEFKPQVTNYIDLKKIWNILCECDRDFIPPLSWYRKDIDEFTDAQKDILVPNVFYKHIIKHPFILIRHHSEVIGFLTFENGKIIDALNELGRVNYVNAVCIGRKYKRYGLKKDLYNYIEERLPKEYKFSTIITRTSDSDYRDKVSFDEMKYAKKAILKSEDDFIPDTIYYAKTINIK